MNQDNKYILLLDQINTIKRNTKYLWESQKEKKK